MSDKKSDIIRETTHDTRDFDSSCGCHLEQ